jgi:ribonuclease P protein component
MASQPQRLKRRAEFLHVAAKGRKAPMPGLVLQALARNDAAPVRLGFTVTKKVGNAVVRNRTRRRLREAARLLMARQPVAGGGPGDDRSQRHAPARLRPVAGRHPARAGQGRAAVTAPR